MKTKPILMLLVLMLNVIPITKVISISNDNQIKLAKDTSKNKNSDKKNKQDKEKKELTDQYSLEQAISDNAQLHTIAFDGLAFLTGNLGSHTFLPPGKVADYFGFQYMRDVDTGGRGHSMQFLTRIANNMLYILNDEQKTQLVELGKIQAPMYKDFAYKRLVLIKAFSQLKEKDIPSGKSGLNKDAVAEYVADLFEIDGKLSYERAKVVGGIIRSFTADQKAYIGEMAFNNSDTWADIKEEKFDKRSVSHEVHVLMMTYISEMFSWYAGSIEADVYFCPERHATYFGSFYMKDIPAVGNPDYFISTEITWDSGKEFLNTLTNEQKKLVTDLVDLSRDGLNEIVQIRQEISTELRRFMKEDNVNKANIIKLSRRYGELDGESSYYCAVNFSKIGWTLTDDQKATLMKLRNLNPKYDCPDDIAYIYADKIKMPEIANTDFLFK